MFTDEFRKIELLCYGLRTNALVNQIYDEQNPYNLMRTGNVGLQLYVGENSLIANVPVFNRFTDESPLSLVQDNGNLYIHNDLSGWRYPFKVVQTPTWYKQKVNSKRSAAQYVLREGESTLICSITDSCGYVSKNVQCRFCAIGENACHPNEPSEERKENILQAIKFALNDRQEDETSINLTGGNSFAADRGASRYEEYIRDIRKISNIPVCIELSPPDSDDSLKMLKDCGCNAVMMNIEVWDKKIREIIMPGKSKIERDRYVSAWKFAVDLFGSGNVSSVLIVGLESIKSEKEAIDIITDCGVIPSIMPFRPNDGAMLENFPITSPEVVYELTQYAVQKIKAASIHTMALPGCIGCRACAAELDIINKIIK